MQRRLPIASLRVDGLPVLDQLVYHAHVALPLMIILTYLNNVIYYYHVALPLIIILIYLNISIYNYHVALPRRCVDSSSPKLVRHQQWHTALK